MDIEELINDRYDPDKPLTDEEFKRLQKKVSLFDLVTDSAHPDDKEPSEATKRYLAECERRGIVLFGAEKS